MFDRIRINGIRFSCVVGIRDWERKRKQSVFVDIVLFINLGEAAVSDDIEKTVDYSALTDRIIFEAKESHHYLLEALAERIAGICLSYPAVERAEVSVTKAKTNKSYKAACITIGRDKKEY